MKKILLIFTLVVCGIFCVAQDIKNPSLSRAKNSISLSTIGADITMVALNYERLFSIRPRSCISGGLGLGYNTVIHYESAVWIFPEITNSGAYLCIPHHITMNLGKRKSFFEFGIGGTAVIGRNAPENYYIYPQVGYRLQPLSANRVNFRIYSTLPPGPLKNLPKIFNGGWYVFRGSGYENWGVWWFYTGVSLGIVF